MKKILISLEEEIVSPSDQARFPLRDGLSEKTKEALVSASKDEIDKAKEEVAAEVREDLKGRAMARLKEQEVEFEERLAEQKEKLAKQEQKQKISLQEQQDTLDAKLEESKGEQLALLEQVRELKHAKQEAQIEAAKEMDEKMIQERAKIVTQEAEKHHQKQQEAEKMLADAKKANEDLQYKLEQSSQQLQGEVLELELQGGLEKLFRNDRISEVKKGQRGADVLQEVRSTRGASAGKILWETKNAKSWSNDWVKKLEQDQMEAGADLAVLVTTVFPANQEGSFYQEGAIWVMRPDLALSMAHALREVLLEGLKQEAVLEGKEAVAGQLYDFLSSRQFAVYMRNFAQSIDRLKGNLTQERRAMERVWKAREKEVDQISSNSASMLGELMALGGDSLKELENVAEYQLPDLELETEELPE